MEAVVSLARQARSKHRHELRTLTYVTLDQSNGGIVRNLNHEGIGVQAVGALRPNQEVRVRFELRNPRVRVEVRGEVTWATISGQCGIRFLDLSPRMTRQVNEWIFGNLLEGIPIYADQVGSMFLASPMVEGETDDGLMLSAAPVPVIELPVEPQAFESTYTRHDDAESIPHFTELGWLSKPLTGRNLIWTINTLVVVAALLLFAMVFLSVTREPPRSPYLTIFGAGVLVVAMYWGFFQLFGGCSPGARLARLAGCDSEKEEVDGPRFR
jgi:hypothetical protein